MKEGGTDLHKTITSSMHNMFGASVSEVYQRVGRLSM